MIGPDATDPWPGVYQRCAPALLRKCERMLGNRADAEDIVQQMFVDLMRRDRRDVDLPYLFRAATSRCINRIRDGRRRAALLARHGSGVFGHVDARVDDRVLSHTLLLQLVDALDDSRAEVLSLYFVDGLTQGEIADMIGVTRRTVNQRIADVREQARALGGGA